jgi:hypothetical protein
LIVSLEFFSKKNYVLRFKQIEHVISHFLKEISEIIPKTLKLPFFDYGTAGKKQSFFYFYKKKN